MTKLSQIAKNATPANNDYLVGVSSGNVDQLSTLAQVAPQIAASIPATAIKTGQIDWSTVALTNMPMRYQQVQVGFGMQATMSRVGNMVFWNMDTVINVSLPSYDSNPLGETMPLGYRPATGTSGTPTGAIIVGNGSPIGWQVLSDGSMTLSNRLANSGAMRIYSSASWITSDAFPA